MGWDPATRRPRCSPRSRSRSSVTSEPKFLTTRETNWDHFGELRGRASARASSAEAELGSARVAGPVGKPDELETQLHPTTDHVLDERVEVRPLPRRCGTIRLVGGPAHVERDDLGAGPLGDPSSELYSSGVKVAGWMPKSFIGSCPAGAAGGAVVVVVAGAVVVVGGGAVVVGGGTAVVVVGGAVVVVGAGSVDVVVLTAAVVAGRGRALRSLRGPRPGRLGRLGGRSRSAGGGCGRAPVVEMSARVAMAGDLGDRSARARGPGGAGQGEGVHQSGDRDDHRGDGHERATPRTGLSPRSDPLLLRIQRASTATERDFSQSSLRPSEAF